MRRLFLIPAMACLCLGASAQVKPAFEAVSIKPAVAPTPQTMVALRPVYNVDASRLEIRNYPLILLLTAAFQIRLEQVVAPDFVRSQYFGMQATLPAGTTKEQVPEMLQNMLAERFRLGYHRESREYQVTVVTVGKGGLKLARVSDDAPRYATTRVPLPDGGMRITMTGKVADLFPQMGSFGGFPALVDETGLDGIYTWVRDQAPGSGASFTEAMHESFKDMIDAAGLKLETRKVQKETIVVDHLEKTPTEN